MCGSELPAQFLVYCLFFLYSFEVRIKQQNGNDRCFWNKYNNYDYAKIQIYIYIFVNKNFDFIEFKISTNDKLL